MIRITALLRNCFHGQISCRRSAGVNQKQPICKHGRRKRRSKNEPVLMVYRVLFAGYDLDFIIEEPLIFTENFHTATLFHYSIIFAFEIFSAPIMWLKKTLVLIRTLVELEPPPIITYSVLM